MTSPRISFGPPEVIVSDRPGGFTLASYDIAPDGRLLMFKPAPTNGDDGARLILVQHASDVLGR